MLLEVYEQDGENYVKVLRNWERVNVCKKPTDDVNDKDFSDCTLNDFTAKLEGNMIPDEEVNSYCKRDNEKKDEQDL